MGGVDIRDQHRQYYHIHVKSCKSYKYIFWFLFEICILNFYILCRYTECTHNKTYLSFWHELTCQLISNYNSHKRRTITRKVIHHDLACSIQHYPINLGSGKRGLC